MATDKMKMELVRSVDGKVAHLRASGTLLADTPRPLADPAKQTFAEPSVRVAVNADGSLGFELSAELVVIPAAPEPETTAEPEVAAENDGNPSAAADNSAPAN